MMEDAALLEKTKCRLLGLRKLRNLATETILSNLDVLTQKKGKKSIQNVLSPEMMENVLQELLKTRRPEHLKTIEKFNGMKQSVLVLLNTRTHKLDLDSLMSFYPEGLNSKEVFYEVLMMISLVAPNIRHLKMNIKNLVDCFASDLIKKVCIRYLSFLKELKILEIVGSSSHRVDLALLCRELPNLRVLSANKITFDGSKMSEEDITKSFGNLTLIEYGSLSTDKKEQIWNVLPNLDIVHDVGKNGLTLEDFILDEKFQIRERTCLSSADYICDSNALLLFTSIRHYKVNSISPTLNMFLKGPNSLESLNLTLMNSSESVDTILLKLGENLRWLSISGHGLPSVQINRISKLCPKLKVLHLRFVKVTGSSSQPAKFVHLDEVVWKDTDCRIGESLTTVLSSATNLQKMTFDTGKYNLQDLQQLKNLMIENKILGSLRSLQWGIRANSSKHVYEEIADIVKNAAAHLPEFRHLKFSYHHVFFNAESYEKTSPLNYFRRFRKNHVLYKAIRDDICFIEFLKSFE